MAKITVRIPQGWDNYLIMDSKDFATLCDIFERSLGFHLEYHDGEDHPVAKQFFLEGKSGARPVMGAEQFEQMKAATLKEAA